MPAKTPNKGKGNPKSVNEGQKLDTGGYVSGTKAKMPKRGAAKKKGKGGY